MILPDHTAVEQVIRQVAADEIVPRFRNLKSHDIREKSRGDIVTTADIEAEKALISGLTALLPGARVVGEESAAEDPGVLHLLAGDGPCWIIDPVDGTRNFSKGDPRFAVIVALAQGGKTLAGWIYDPLQDVFAHAQAGQGAWIGTQRLKVSDRGERGSLGPGMVKRLTECRLSAGRPLPKEMTRYHCVGLEYIDLARGKLDFAAYGGKLKPWDHAAGTLMVREAGGYDRLLMADHPYQPVPTQNGEMLIVARDAEQWRSVREDIRP